MDLAILAFSLVITALLIDMFRSKDQEESN